MAAKLIELCFRRGGEESQTKVRLRHLFSGPKTVPWGPNARKYAANRRRFFFSVSLSAFCLTLRLLIASFPLLLFYCIFFAKHIVRQ